MTLHTSSTRIRVNELSNLNKNTQNLSILVRYANFYVKNLRTKNDKMTQFHWSRKSRDSCPTSSDHNRHQPFIESDTVSLVTRHHKTRLWQPTFPAKCKALESPASLSFGMLPIPQVKS